jgi:hypothetical protein
VYEISHQLEGKRAIAIVLIKGFAERRRLELICTQNIFVKITWPVADERTVGAAKQ